MYAAAIKPTYTRYARLLPIHDENVPMPYRLSSAMSRHSLPCKIAVTSKPTGTLTMNASQLNVAVTTKYAPSVINGPNIKNTSGKPAARYLYSNGGAVYI
ncbi:MAG: hypothetical protein HDKAJFGB_02254 [Anaerolineae bacterium]|nr:hypothetical protein [Anaerolineae bacterium]